MISPTPLVFISFCYSCVPSRPALFGWLTPPNKGLEHCLLGRGCWRFPSMADDDGGPSASYLEARLLAASLGRQCSSLAVGRPLGSHEPLGCRCQQNPWHGQSSSQLAALGSRSWQLAALGSRPWQPPLAGANPSLAVAHASISMRRLCVDRNFVRRRTEPRGKLGSFARLSSG